MELFEDQLVMTLEDRVSAVSAISVGPLATLRDTMQTIDNAAAQNAPVGIALVVDGGLLAGIVTDGDIRQALIEGTPLEAPVSEIMISDPVTVSKGGLPSEMLREMTEKVRQRPRIKDSRVRYLVVVDEEGSLPGSGEFHDEVHRRVADERIVRGQIADGLTGHA